MADGASDDDVIHLASFNVHRSQGYSARSARQRELITISDDSDEEPVTLVPGSPVLVPDDPDDDVSILMTIRRRQVIRPAATWSSSSGEPIQVIGQTAAASGTTSGEPNFTQSTSRDVQTSTMASKRPIRTELPLQPQPSTSGHTQPQPSTSTYSQAQPKLHTLTQPQNSSSIPAKSQSKCHTITQPQNSSSSPAKSQSKCYTITQPQPGTSTHIKAEPQASTSTYTKPNPSTQAQQSSSTSSSTHTQAKPSTSAHTQDNPLASTSSSHVQSKPRPHTHTQTLLQASTSAQPQPSAVINTQTQVVPQQPRPQAPTRQKQPQANSLPRHIPLNCTQGNLIQILPKPEPQQQPVTQAPPAPQERLARGRAVLIAAAPERLGPPEVGHRITLGSQAPGEANRTTQPQAGAPNQGQHRMRMLHSPPAPNPNARVPNTNPNPPAPPALTHFLREPIRADLVLAPAVAPAPAPNPEGADPAPVPPALAPAVIPRPEDARPGPSVPREAHGAERPEQQPHVRTLITGVLDLFPDVQEAYIADLIQQNNVKDLNVICNMLLENPAYPRREIAATTAAPTSILLEPGDTNTQQVTEDLFDYAKLEAVGPEAVMQAADLLMADFRMLSCQDIKWALNSLKGHYAITRKTLCEALKKWQEAGDPSGKRRRSRTSSERCFINFLFEQGSVKFTRKLYLLEKDRRYCKTYGSLEASVEKEVTFYQQKAKEWAEHEDFLLALQVNEDEYKKDGQLIECGCCYGEFAFEKMTQCSDGHLFCKECLVKYAQEAVFGTGQSELSCMEGGCPCSYPVCELEKVLPENILYKYYERQAEEAVAATCADELVRCPFCNFPALLDKGMSLFSCPNPRCRKESCRKCHVQWKEHVGKTCEQVLERDEIRMRVLFEERMTAARVRKCVKCGTGLVKSEGCNRMSCRCGGFMCYLCREPISGYNHFCQHARSPGAPCRHCRKCSLWSDPTQDDERIIQEIQKKGEEELSKKSTDHSGKRVGPPPEPATVAKRPRVGPPPQNLPNHPGPLQPQAVRAPLLVPPRVIYPLAPPAGQDQMFLAPFVPPWEHFPPLNNNHNHHHPHPVNHNGHHHNIDVMDMPMHYGPPHRHFRR